MADAPALPQMNAGEPVPAGKGLRFANFFIDSIILNVIGFFVGVVLVVMLLSSGYTMDEEGNFTNMPLWMNLSLNFANIPITIAYFIILESLLGRTIGKLITGTKVVNAEGGTATMGQVVGRTFARFIPFEAFSFLGETSRGWHDSLSKTYVVKN